MKLKRQERALAWLVGVMLLILAATHPAGAATAAEAVTGAGLAIVEGIAGAAAQHPLAAALVVAALWLVGTVRKHAPATVRH